MKWLLTPLALLLFFHVSATTLSPYSKVSVLTCNPGPEPYAIFGHSAIRVTDSVTGIDIVFNYGTFDFDDPHFYRKFLGGRLLYFLSASTFSDFLPEYQEGGRIVWEQVLKMTTAEKQAIYDRLLDNLREEHRYYKYDFLYDNCSTRIRDDIQYIRSISSISSSSSNNNTSNSSLRTNNSNSSSSLSSNNNTNNSSISSSSSNSWITPPPAGIRSFRQQFGSTYSYNPWTGFGIDVCTGLPADKHPSASENLFLPQNLFDALRRANLVDTTIVYDFSGPTQRTALDWTSPLAVCWILFAISVFTLAAELRLRRRMKTVATESKAIATASKAANLASNAIAVASKTFDIVLLTITGLAGLAMLSLWAFTDHRISHWNLNLLWACPLNLAALITPRFKKSYFNVYPIVLSLLAVFILIAPRFLNPAVLPLILTLLTRTISQNIKQ